MITLSGFGKDYGDFTAVDSLTMNTTVFGCIGEAPGSARGEPGEAHTNWKTRPTRAACGSCHDHVDFATGEGHSPFELEQGDDSQCTIFLFSMANLP